MSTRGMVAVQFSMNGGYRLYYRHCDTYPTGLGYELISKLKAAQIFGWHVEGIDKILEEVGCVDEKRTAIEPEDAFLHVQGDLEYIYVIKNVDDPTTLSVQILRTSNPRSTPNFAFPIYFSYIRFVSIKSHELMTDMARVEGTAGMILHALEAYHRAAQSTVKVVASSSG